MMKKRILFLLLALSFLGVIKAEAAEIHVAIDKTYQTMDGVGANCYTYSAASDLGWSWDQVKYVFDELSLEYIRLATWFDWWEPKNDNTDPYQFNWLRFDPNRIIKNHDLKLIKHLHERGIEVIPGIWRFGSWLSKGSPLSIDENDFPEMGESIAAYLIRMREEGIPIQVAEVQNEPDIPAYVVYSSAEKLKSAHQHLIDQLKRNQLDDIQLHLPNLHSPVNTVAWSKVLLSDPEILERTAAISYHTWWVDKKSEFESIWYFAKSVGKPVWATEVGYCPLRDGCFGGSHYLKPETWETAWDYAISYYRAIAWSHATRVFHWALLGSHAVVKQNGEKLPSFYVLKHFANYIPKDTILIESTTSDPNLLTLVFKGNDGLNAILINKSSKSINASLKINSGGKIEITEAFTSVKNHYMAETDILQDGNPEIVLPAMSVTSLSISFLE